VIGTYAPEVRRDKFELDAEFETRLAFPCCVCVHRNGSDRDEPCAHCDRNLTAIPDEVES